MTTDKLSSRDQSVLATADTQPLAEAFCTWPLPATVCSDPCASMTPAQGYTYPRSGTNLLTVAEAKAMFDHLVERGLLFQAAPSNHGVENPHKALLAMEITSGKLVISIGVDALAHAVARSPALHGSRVVNADAFAKEVLDRLGDGDDETGLSLIQHALDDAAEQATDQGSKNIICPGDD